jgi:hypothetical protein
MMKALPPCTSTGWRHALWQILRWKGFKAFYGAKKNYFYKLTAEDERWEKVEFF